jgi:hypothetical protein
MTGNIQSPRPRAPRSAPGRFGAGMALRCSIAAAGLLLAAPASALDLDEPTTVVTLARNGAWGVATGSTGEAIAAAIRACRAMAAGPSDCGARFTTTRGGWVVANLCGDHQIIVSADSREAAAAAALDREAAVRRRHVPALPPCRHVLTVDPLGIVAAIGAQPLRQSEKVTDPSGSNHDR